ncbi:MAG: NADH-quinone oxidoreductase subunit C, partial [Gammaproteobacteria bacterium]
MSDLKVEKLNTAIADCLGERVRASHADRGELTIVVDAEELLECAQMLRDAAELSFRQLVDLSGVDYLSYGQADWQTQSATDSGFSRGVSKSEAELPGDISGRFAVVYHLLSVEHNFRVRL